MNYNNIILCDTANGEGIRTSLFVSGCTNHCQGCFNKEAQDFNYGQLYTPETEQTILKQISKPYIAGLSILGGNPYAKTMLVSLILSSLPMLCMAWVRQYGYGQGLCGKILTTLK